QRRGRRQPAADEIPFAAELVVYGPLHLGVLVVLSREPREGVVARPRDVGIRKERARRQRRNAPGRVDARVRGRLEYDAELATQRLLIDGVAVGPCGQTGRDLAAADHRVEMLDAESAGQLPALRQLH